MEEEKNPLIATILADAENEAARIVAQAEKSGELQRVQAEKRAAAIVEQAKADGTAQAERKIAQVQATLEMEKKRMELQRKASISNYLLQRLDARFREIVDTHRYREFLKQWLVEAVVGLERPWAEVVTSPLDPIHQSLISEVMEESSRLLGYSVTLVVAEEKDPTMQGVMVYSKDRKTAYNNTVATRTKRYATEMYRIIHQAVLGVDNG